MSAAKGDCNGFGRESCSAWRRGRWRNRRSMTQPVLRELRPAALQAARLILAQEMERVLREWVDSGTAAKMSR